MEALRARLCKESAEAEGEWARVSRILTDARAKDDDLRAEVKWRIAEKQTAERAVAEAESRHALVSAALIQAEKESISAAAMVTQKQALLGQLWEYEAQLLQQSKLLDEAKQEAKEAKANVKERQQQLELLTQELRSLKDQYEHEKYMAKAMQEQNKKLSEDLKAHEDLRYQENLSRDQLELVKAEKQLLEKELKSQQVEKEKLSEKCNRAEVQVIEMKSREGRMFVQNAALQDALKTAQDDAAALRARLESYKSSRPDLQVDRRDEADGLSRIPSKLQPHPSIVDEFTGSDVLTKKCQGLGDPPWSNHLKDNQHEKDAVTPTHSREVITKSEGDLVKIADRCKDQTATKRMAVATGPVEIFPDTQIVEDPPKKRPRSEAAETCEKATRGSEVESRPAATKLTGEIEPEKGLFRRQCIGLAETKVPNKPGDARAPKRSKEEVEKLAHSMFSSKPLPRQLRAPPLKLYPAHIEYVLANWDMYVLHNGQKPREFNKGPGPKPDPTGLDSGPPGPWTAVQNFLKASASAASESSSPRMRCIVSRACQSEKGGSFFQSNKFWDQVPKMPKMPMIPYMKNPTYQCCDLIIPKTHPHFSCR